MFKFVSAIILITFSVVGFFIVTKPLYENISDLKIQATAYNQALTNANSLESEKDKLTQKYNSMSTENLAKLNKLLPDNVDNIRLILEIGQVALPYGMVLKNVKYDVVSSKPEDSTVAAGTAPTTDVSGAPLKDYGDWDLEFSVSGTYDNFISFLNDLENNLRIIDISSIDFSSNSSGTGTNLTTNQTNTYNYNFKIKTYWLKN